MRFLSEFQEMSFIDVGDGCWRRNVLATILRCWWFWTFSSTSFSTLTSRTNIVNDPTDHWQNGLNRVGSKMRFYRLRNNQHQRNKLIFRIAWARINISLIWKKNTGWVRINGTIIFLYPDFVRQLTAASLSEVLLNSRGRSV